MKGDSSSVAPGLYTPLTLILPSMLQVELDKLEEEISGGKESSAFLLARRGALHRKVILFRMLHASGALCVNQVAVVVAKETEAET